MNTPLRKARQNAGLTLTKAATGIGIDPGQLSRIERGGGTTPETAEKIVAFFDGLLTEEHIFYPERFQEHVSPATDRRHSPDRRAQPCPGRRVSDKGQAA